MADPIRAADENFDYNFASAISLLNLFPRKERRVIQKWLDRLREMHSGTSEVLATRNDFMWTLLLCMETNNLVPPFDQPPPPGQPTSAQQVMPEHTYGEVLRRTHAMTEAAPADSGAHRLSAAGRLVAPQDFLRSQPMPRDGAFCYMAAFSDWR